MLLKFPTGKRVCRHGLASRAPPTVAADRAARAVINAAVTPAACAGALSKTADHHSAGIESRCHHFDTAEALAPMSEAIASFEAQSAMMERNVVNSDMANPLGQFVLIGKVILSYDCELACGHTVLMAKKPTRADLRVQFAQRVKRARETCRLSQAQVAKGLGIKQDRYKHYEVDRYLPHDMIEAFCLICDVEPAYFYPHAPKAKRGGVGKAA